MNGAVRFDIAKHSIWMVQIKEASSIVGALYCMALYWRYLPCFWSVGGWLFQNKMSVCSWISSHWVLLWWCFFSIIWQSMLALWMTGLCGEKLNSSSVCWLHCIWCLYFFSCAVIVEYCFNVYLVCQYTLLFVYFTDALNRCFVTFLARPDLQLGRHLVFHRLTVPVIYVTSH